MSHKLNINQNFNNNHQCRQKNNFLKLNCRMHIVMLYCMTNNQISMNHYKLNMSNRKLNIKVNLNKNHLHMIGCRFLAIDCNKYTNLLFYNSCIFIAFPHRYYMQNYIPNINQNLNNIHLRRRKSNFLELNCNMDIVMLYCMTNNQISMNHYKLNMSNRKLNINTISNRNHQCIIVCMFL